MLYHSLLLIASTLFSVQFVFYTKYQKASGNSLLSAVRFALGVNFVACLVALLSNGFQIEVTPFSAAVAAVMAAILVTFSYVSVKALSYANLAIYSMFAMLGGMLVPFVGGILLWDEGFGIQKAVCCLLVVVALFTNLPKEKGTRSGVKYYILTFVLNGLIGLVAKFHQSGVGYNVPSKSYIALYCAFAVVISAVLYGFLRFRQAADARKVADGQRPSTDERTQSLFKPRAAMYCILGYGVVNWAGNLLLLIALLHLPASVQYPMVTGAVIAMSTLASFIIGEKPEKRTVLSAALAVVGLIVLVL